MSIIEPLCCGFAKVAAYTIFSNKQHLERHPGECSAKFKSRQCMFKYNTFREFFADEKFHVDYKTFINNFPKITVQIATIAKKNPQHKREILNTFRLENWKEMVSTKKNLHSLTDCKGCSHHEQYNALLSLFPVKKFNRLGKQKTQKLNERNKILVQRTNQVYNIYNHILDLIG